MKEDSMFIRRNKTYDLPNGQVFIDFKNDSNPLFIISKILRERTKVLDIGAGNGIFAKYLMENHFECCIDGIEPSKYASQLAKQYYRKFYIGEAQEFYKEIKSEEYDYIILADVIEHMQNPLNLLKELRAIIPYQCKIILSLPNVAFGAVRFSLMNGIFDYSDSGILENTHLRFFTLKTIESLVENSEFYIEKIFYLQRKLNVSEINLERLKLNPLIFYHVKNDPLAFTYQFVVILTKKQCIPENIYIGERSKFNYLKYFIRRHKNFTPISILFFLVRLLKRLK